MQIGPVPKGVSQITLCSRILRILVYIRVLISCNDLLSVASVSRLTRHSDRIATHCLRPLNRRAIYTHWGQRSRSRHPPALLPPSASCPREQFPRSILVATSSSTRPTRATSSRGCYEDVARVSGVSGDLPVPLATCLTDCSAGGLLRCIVVN